MGVRWKYTPPARNAVALLAAAAPAATHTIAEQLLTESQALVPVDTGDLKDSGRVTQHGSKATVSYDVLSPDGYPYGIRQHEDLTLHHPNGGQAKFLEQPMRTDPARRFAVAADILRRALAR